MASRKNAQSTAAEVSLVHLKNCLVNLPPSLVSLLVSVNTPAQNVVVELNYRDPAHPNAGSQGAATSAQTSIFLGWTGMPSKRKTAAPVGRDGINGTRVGQGPREQDVPLVEIDPTLAGTIGLRDGQKVTARIHVDPPMAHTVNIEPLTPEDWEIIELHATFLELNLLSQIRALPNPAYSPAAGITLEPHPLTLHLSPTSTANIKVLSLEPAPTPDTPFVKIAPDAEVIVAPKTRSKPSRSSRENRSVTSTSRKSGRSAASTVRRKSGKEERKPALFLRGVDRNLCAEWFDDEAATKELCVWVDRDLLVSREFRGLKWVTVTVLKPASLQPAQDPQKQQAGAEAVAEGLAPSGRVVARLCPWDDPPNGTTTALSSPLCASLGCPGMIGGVAKIEPAPPPLPRTSVQHLKVYPFQSAGVKSDGGLKFGGESKTEREETAKRIQHIYSGTGLLEGPISDGLVLGVFDGLEIPSGWDGGIVKLDPAQVGSQGAVKDPVNWFLASEHRVPIEVQPPISRPSALAVPDSVEALSSSDDVLVGIDSLLSELKSHLSHMSSVLLTGALGSGKTSVAKLMARRLREDHLCHTTYFPCRKLVNDESRIATVRETLNRVFMEASWGARLGGKSLVILDDLDRLCPAEQELQVGNDNGRSRQISEAICAIVRQYCGRDSNVVLLASCVGKDTLHHVLVGGHVVREIVELKAPDKEGRRKIMEFIAQQHAAPAVESEAVPPINNGSRPTTADGSAAGDDGNAWMDGSQPSRRHSVSNTGGFVLQPDLDFLDLAGKTDGYVPGDLNLLLARTRNEALMRSVNELPFESESEAVPLAKVDFDQALKGFTPASLRNVTLQSSATTFGSIGGLQEIRRVLLETLEYPTKYAPIFAQCPLRLRSGLLLYGYPGCGKTLLASAVAGECGLNFISVKGPEILNKYIGASEKSVRDLFERAQAARPCVLFFDEFDSIAPKRGHDSTGVTDRVVNQLLTQMDGAEGLSGVYVLAATSRPDLIDPALLRPGRLDKSLLCDFPNLEDRLDIIKALAKKARLSEDVLGSEEDLQELGRRTEGFSGADLQALVSNAQLEAIHDVLNSHENGASTSATAIKRNARLGKQGSSSAQVFVQFRYGEEEEEEEAAAAQAETERGAKSGLMRSSELAEQAAIAAKLEGLKLARKRAKVQKGGHSQGNGDAGKGKAAGEQHPDVVISWKHIVKALEGTRASISAEERVRLERIYREFVVGRSGEMRDGQGGMEIGGRSSLM